MPTATAIETVPEPWTVAGTPLKPFSLGHHLLLKRLGLPFADAPFADADSAEFVAGIAVCAGHSYEWTLGMMLAGDWGNVVERWRKHVCGPWWNRRRIDWKQAKATFQLYLSDGYKSPPVCRRDGASGIELTAPWECLLKCELVGAGFSETEVFNGYLPARWYDYFTVSELKQLANCRDPKNWRKVFWTADDEAKIKQAEEVSNVN